MVHRDIHQIKATEIHNENNSNKRDAWYFLGIKWIVRVINCESVHLIFFNYFSFLDLKKYYSITDSRSETEELHPNQEENGIKEKPDSSSQ